MMPTAASALSAYSCQSAPIALSNRNALPMSSAPKVITLREPYLSIQAPTNGETMPLTTAAMALPAAMAARLQPKCSCSGTRNTGGAYSPMPTVMNRIRKEPATIHQP